MSARRPVRRGATNGATTSTSSAQPIDNAAKRGATTKAAREPAWAVRGVSAETQNAARLAARRAGLTIGEWVEQRLRAAAMGELRGPAVPAAINDDVMAAILAQLEKRDREAAATAEAVANLKSAFEAIRERKSWLARLFSNLR